MKTLTKKKTTKTRKGVNTTTTTTTTNSLVSALQQVQNVAFTQNGALSLATTNSAVLDFFSLGGSLRNRGEQDIISFFTKAYFEDRLLALKALFYFRDVRGGQGERRTFRVVLNYLGNNYPDVVRKNLHLVDFYGRYDDLYSLFNTPVEKDVLDFMKERLNLDLSLMRYEKNVSLLAKWLSSENASSPQTRLEGSKIRKHLGLTPKQYRQTLSKLRKYIDVVERKMTGNEWEQINYERVPSRASMIYRKAFQKHDPSRYQEYKDKVAKGEAKINTSTLYPYDLVRNVRSGAGDQTLDLQWKNLPDYCGEFKGLAVCDVSGSMTAAAKGSVAPIDVSVSLGLYLGERMKGPFQDCFITFSGSPELQKIQGNTLSEKVFNLNHADWAMNTDLQKVFDLILNTAKQYKLKQKDLPDYLIIISDMQFDVACSNNDKTNFEVIEDKFEKAGYKRPNLVFWNVNALGNDAPVKRNESGVLLCSGASPTIFKAIMEQKEITPYDMMLEVLNSKRYEPVSL